MLDDSNGSVLLRSRSKRLSLKERTVLSLVASGKDVDRIGDQLGIDAGDVRVVVYSINKILGLPEQYDFSEELAQLANVGERLVIQVPVVQVQVDKQPDPPKEGENDNPETLAQLIAESSPRDQKIIRVVCKHNFETSAKILGLKTLSVPSVVSTICKKLMMKPRMKWEERLPILQMALERMDARVAEGVLKLRTTRRARSNCNVIKKVAATELRQRLGVAFMLLPADERLALVKYAEERAEMKTKTKSVAE